MSVIKTFSLTSTTLTDFQITIFRLKKTIRTRTSLIARIKKFFKHNKTKIKMKVLPHTNSAMYFLLSIFGLKNIIIPILSLWGELTQYSL